MQITAINFGQRVQLIIYLCLLTQTQTTQHDSYLMILTFSRLVEFLISIHIMLHFFEDMIMQINNRLRIVLTV